MEEIVRKNTYLDIFGHRERVDEVVHRTEATEEKFDERSDLQQRKKALKNMRRRLGQRNARTFIAAGITAK